MILQQEEALPALLFRSALFLFVAYWLLISIRLSVTPMHSTGIFFMVATSVVSITTMLLAYYRVWVRQAGYFFIAGIMLLVIARAYLAGGAESPILMTLIIAPITAMFLLGRLAGIVFSVAVLVSILIFVLLDTSGHVFPDMLMEGQSLLIVRNTLIVFVMAVSSWVSWLYARSNDGLTSKLLDQTRRDHLTNVPNRRAFDFAIEKEIRLAKRQSYHLSLFMVDIDNFKNFNDVYGHNEGDRCLIRVANIIQSCLRRPGDMVARYGGEEFAVILPDTALSQAQQLAETMRHAVLGLNTTHEDSSRGVVTITLGISDMSLDVEMSAKELTRRADEALYAGKAAGRNQVVTLSNNPDTPIEEESLA